MKSLLVNIVVSSSKRTENRVYPWILQSSYQGLLLEPPSPDNWTSLKLYFTCSMLYSFALNTSHSGAMETEMWRSLLLVAFLEADGKPWWKSGNWMSGPDPEGLTVNLEQDRKRYSPVFLRTTPDTLKSMQSIFHGITACLQDLYGYSYPWTYSHGISKLSCCNIKFHPLDGSFHSMLALI